MPLPNVSIDDLFAHAHALRAAHEELMAQRAAVKTRVALIVGEEHAGDRASIMFRGALQQYDSGADDALEGLKKLAAFIQNYAEAVAETDRTLNESFEI